MEWLRSMAHFDECYAPLVTAIVLGFIAGGLAVYILNWALVLMGAALGAVLYLEVERIIITAAPSTESATIWNYSVWLCLAAAVVGAILCKAFERHVFIVATVVIGW